jgi:hypothetical protein
LSLESAYLLGITIITPPFLAGFMCPTCSVSFSDPAYAIFSSWPKKTRSRSVSETLEDHKRCLDRTRDIERLKQDVENLSDALIELGYARRVAEVLGLEE